MNKKILSIETIIKENNLSIIYSCIKAIISATLLFIIFLMFKDGTELNKLITTYGSMNQTDIEIIACIIIFLIGYLIKTICKIIAKKKENNFIKKEDFIIIEDKVRAKIKPSRRENKTTIYTYSIGLVRIDKKDYRNIKNDDYVYLFFNNENKSIKKIDTDSAIAISSDRAFSESIYELDFGLKKYLTSYDNGVEKEHVDETPKKRWTF